MNENSGKSIKIISVILALFILAAALPSVMTDVSADQSAELVGSGECGSDCAWRFYDDGSFHIEGYGEMNEADSYLPEWNIKYKTRITEVVIGDGITLVARNSFDGCENLKSVTIGRRVKKIGSAAFKNCSSLTKENVIIPDTPILIGENAFKDAGFYNDESSWENGLLYLGGHLLKAKEDIAGIRTIKDMTSDIAVSAFFDCRELTETVLPDSVKIIGGSAFYRCEKLESVNIPYGVETLPESVFEYCKSLKSIDVPSSVRHIGIFAFSGCAGLTDVTIPESVETVGWNAFADCLSLNKATVYSVNAKIGKDAFGYFGNGTKNESFVMRCYKYSAAGEYAKETGFETEYMERDYIKDFKQGSTVDDYVKRYPGRETEFKDAKGGIITSGLIFTGLKVRSLNSEDGAGYEFAIAGDADGNGKIDSTDCICVKRHILRISALYGAYGAAADTDGNGNIDGTDYISVKRCLLGITELS